MFLFNLFGKKEEKSNNAAIAKERLLITVAHQRADRTLSPVDDEPAYMQSLKSEILEVVRRYIPVDLENIETNIGKDAQGNFDTLALNIILPKQNEDVEDVETNRVSNTEKLQEIIEEYRIAQINGQEFDLQSAADKLFAIKNNKI